MNRQIANRQIATCVICDGPYAEQDKWGDEFPTWVVAVSDEDGEPVGKTYTCFSFEKAQGLARNIARDRKLEFVNDASPA